MTEELKEIKKTVSPEDVVDVFGVTEDFAREICAEIDRVVADGCKGDDVEAVMERLAEVGGLGRDYVGGMTASEGFGDGAGGYWLGSFGCFVNMGDTYDETLVFDAYNEEFVIDSWGEVLSRVETQYAEDNELVYDESENSYRPRHDNAELDVFVREFRASWNFGTWTFRNVQCGVMSCPATGKYCGRITTECKRDDVCDEVRDLGLTEDELEYVRERVTSSEYDDEYGKYGED